VGSVVLVFAIDVGLIIISGDAVTFPVGTLQGAHPARRRNVTKNKLLRLDDILFTMKIILFENNFITNSPLTNEPVLWIRSNNSWE
jgi:hypothetical protein